MNLQTKIRAKCKAFYALALVALLLSAHPIAAQKVVPPVSKETLKVTLPKAKEATLKNGLRVVVLEGYDQLPTFTMQMVILSGGLSDPPDSRGLASFTASLLREGTRTRTSLEIAEQVESLGATLSANSDLSSFTTTVTSSGLAQNLGRVLDILTDVVREPVFPADELEKHKTRTVSQLQLQRTNPNFLAGERFSRVIYGDQHPAGFVSSPVDSLKKTTSADLKKFHSEHYLPSNAILTVVGQVTLKEILPKIERELGDWKRGDAPKTETRAVPNQSAPKIYLIDRPGSVQTVLQLGNLGITRTDPDYFALLVMDKVVGTSPTSRLFRNLREDKGYTYGAYSNFGGSKFRGTWAANSEVRTAVTEGAMKEFMFELKRIRDERVAPDELDNAKHALVGSFALSLERPQTLLQNIITQKLYDLPADYWDTYPQKVAEITAADVQRVAQKYVDLSHLQIVAVGDAAQIRDVLAKYGTVEAYDSEGKLIKATDSK
ncbi:MAG: insulinase family protein [Pyrinomonadaceae bacterium]|nr:insulinase family protein [Pyrinomonadaceae bacterium]